MNILLKISYDGTNYAGWQRQPNVSTVQGQLEKALSQILGCQIGTLGAGRTDSGVHALGQCASFELDTLPFPVSKLAILTTAQLPEDIVVRETLEVPKDFHPRYSAKNKTYQYKILNAPLKDPMLRNYTEYVKKPLDFNKMQEATKYFLGTHDFKAFSSTGGTVKTSVRTILEITLEKQKYLTGDIITLTVTGDSFLYNMVRIMVGTLIDIGLGKKEPNHIKDIILSKDRTKASKTAKPSGLTLIEIKY